MVGVWIVAGMDECVRGAIMYGRWKSKKWMKKKYFDLDDWQLEKISEFFRENPDGVITFG